MYNSMIGRRRLAISFQTEAELLGGRFRGERRRRLNDLLAAMLKLPQRPSTSECYARVAAKRKELRKRHSPGGDASDADVWIISGALEHGLPLLSHDKKQVPLGRAVGLRILTNLEGLRDENPVI